MDFILWGKCEIINDYRNVVVYKLNFNVIYYIIINDKLLNVEFKINNKILFIFIDIMMDKDNLLSFFRKLKSYIYIFINGEVVFKGVERKCKYLSIIKKDIMYLNNFIIMDLEIRNLNGILNFICVFIYDGKIKFFFFILDYLNID